MWSILTLRNIFCFTFALGLMNMGVQTLLSYGVDVSGVIAWGMREIMQVPEASWLPWKAGFWRGPMYSLLSTMIGILAILMPLVFSWWLVDSVLHTLGFRRPVNTADQLMELQNRIAKLEGMTLKSKRSW